MTRVVITALTFGALAVAMVLGVTWFAMSPPGQRWEPAVNTLALLAGVTGIFAERWASRHEQRKQAIESIRLEMTRNREVLDDEAFSPTRPRGRRIYPRLVQSAVDSALSTGALDPRHDVELINLLHRWRTAVSSLNQRLELTEMLVFTTTSDDLAEQLHKALHGPTSFLNGMRTMLDQAQTTLGEPPTHR
ncbi:MULTISPECIES: hypothetical protein [unclassified Saccharothrix]|uniref:hypothetical protein n=1 Tax=unclassified Saccharothrix TaxID=2593673 RepID=UPI00307CF429